MRPKKPSFKAKNKGFGQSSGAKANFPLKFAKSLFSASKYWFKSEFGRNLCAKGSILVYLVLH